MASFILGENEAPHVGLMIGGFVTIVFSVLIFGIVMCMKCATKLDDKKQNPTVHDFTVKEIQKAYWTVLFWKGCTILSMKFSIFHQRTFMKRSIATLIRLSELSKKYSVWKKNILISIAGNTPTRLKALIASFQEIQKSQFTHFFWQFWHWKVLYSSNFVPWRVQPSTAIH